MTAVCKLPQAKKVIQDGLKRAKMLSKTMQVTRDGEVLSETIATLEKGLELINAKDYDKLAELDKSALISSIPAVVARQHLTDVFEAAIGPSANSQSKRSKMVLKNAKFEDGVLTIVVSPEGQTRHWTFKYGSDDNASSPSEASGNRIYIPEFDSVYRTISRTTSETNRVLRRKEILDAKAGADAAMKAMFGTDEDTANILASSAENVEKAFNYNKASQVKNYKHGSVSDMENLLDDLHALSDNGIPTEQYDHYKSLLGKMHEGFFRKTNVYINENQDHAYGWVDIDKDHILLNVSSKLTKGMSNAEVYMHEVIHTMTMWALRSNTPEAKRLLNRLDYLRKAASKKITWKTLHAIDPNLSEEGAKELHKYIFDSEHSDDEFLAYALTNPTVMKALEPIMLKDERKTGLLSAIIDFFTDLMNVVMGNYDFSHRNANLKDEIHTLAFKLADINAKADDMVEQGGLLNRVHDVVDSLESGFEEWVKELPDRFGLDRHGAVESTEGMTKAQKAIFIAKFFIKGLYNKNFRHEVGRYFTLLKVKPNSTAREVLRNFIPGLEYDIEPQWHGMQTNKIDMTRNTHVAFSTMASLSKFKQRPTESEEIAITDVLVDANMSTLFDKKHNGGKGYSKDQLLRMMTDTSYRKRLIAQKERAIKNQQKARGNWIVGQAKGLANYMITGKGHEAQNQNSASIALGHKSNQLFKMDHNLHKQIEELTALHALDMQNIGSVNQVARLLKTEKAGIENIVEMYEATKAMSKEEFKDNPAHMVEGYSRELFDDTIDARIEPLSNKEELERKGYKYIATIEDKDLMAGDPLGYFVSGTYAKAERQKGAVELGSPGHRGFTRKDMRFRQFPDSKKHAYAWYENDKLRLDKKAAEINKQLEAGVDPLSIPTGYMPVTDGRGVVVDYRAQMSKADKARYLGQDKTISNVLAKTSGSLVEKVAREQQNERVLESIKKEAAKTYDNLSSEDALKEFTLITPNSTDPEIKSLYYMMPRSFQEYAENREDKGLPIPTILIPQYFGYSHMMLTGLPGVNLLPTTIKRVINLFETYFLDMIKIAKGNILMKMPVVLVGNLVSNILYAVSTGMPISEIWGAYKDSFRDVKLFMAKHKESEAKKIELAGLIQGYNTRRFKNAQERADYTDKVNTLKNEIARLEKEMARSDIKELFDLGMYQSVIEDVNMNKMGDTNKLTDGMDKLLSKTPTIVRTPLQWAYLSKETKWYQINQEVLQLSDLVARDVMNRKQKRLEELQADGKKDLPYEYRKHIGKLTPKRRKLGDEERAQFFKISERSRHANLLNSFVNYNLPNGRFEEFMNRLGLLMFTKYMKRIQHVITRSSIEHPIRSTLTFLGASFMLDLDMIQDQSLMVEAFDDNNFGIFGVIPWYSPLDNFLNVVTPAVIKPFT